jgi:hypothetical protein
MLKVLVIYSLTLLALAPSCGKAAELEVFLTQLDGGDGLRYLDVWSGRFDDYSGKSWDVASLYKPMNTVFYIRGSFTVLSEKWALSPTFYADSGYRSPLLNAEPMLNVGITLAFNLTSRTTISFSDNAVYSRFGEVSEMPCYDTFDRSYHCGTGLSWLDSFPYHRSRVYPQMSKLTLVSRF